jgi:hypothetical protein
MTNTNTAYNQLRNLNNYAIPKGTTAARHFMETYNLLQVYIAKESFSMISPYAEEMYQITRYLEIEVHLMMVDRSRR